MIHVKRRQVLLLACMPHRTQMPFHCKILGVFLSALLAVVSASGESVETLPGLGKEASVFLEKHCISCHGPKKSKASLRLDQMPLVIRDGHDAEIWQDVLDAMNASEMPPEDESQPTAEEMTGMIETLTNGLYQARERLQNTGAVVLRRLNKREYANTVHDLLGVRVDTSSFPDDGDYEGFDTVGNALSVSTLHFERYRQLAKTSLDAAFEEREKPESTKRQIQVEEDWLASLEIATRESREFLKSPEAANKTVGFRKKRRSRVLEAENYVKFPGAMTGLIMGRKSSFNRGVNEHTILLYKNTPGKYVLRFRAGLTTAEPNQTYYLEARRVIWQQKGRVEDFVESLGTVALTKIQPQGEVFEIPFEKTSNGRREFVELRVSSSTLQHIADQKKATRRKRENAPEPARIWLDWVGIEGPLIDVWPPPAWNEFFPRGFVVSQKEESEYAQNIIRRFASEAFRRRPPSDNYVDQLVRIYKDYRADGYSFVDAVNESLAIVLASPSFLYLVEAEETVNSDTTKGPDHRALLSDRELACRLSYFLWSAPPDDRLYALAAEGELSKPKVLAAEVERMLDDKRSQGFVEAFSRQWLELDRLDMIVVASGFKDFSESLRASFKRETIEFMAELIRSDLGADQLIDSDFVVVDAQLANHYGLSGQTEPGFQIVKLPADSPRGGLIGQAAILTLTGTGERTSPVERGVFVLRKLLGNPPPPPPPNVPQLEIEATISVRDRLAMHTQQPQCASCHQRIDPIGFGLENFDAIGSWREKEGKMPIDSSGIMPDGQREFRGAQELKSRLREDLDPTAEALLRAMMTYAVGRRIGFEDDGNVKSLQAGWKVKNYGLRSLIHLLVQSDTFRLK